MIYRRVVKCNVFKFHILPVSGINANYRYHQWALDIKLRRKWIGARIFAWVNRSVVKKKASGNAVKKKCIKHLQKAYP
jgi:hypothetical protein